MKHSSSLPRVRPMMSSPGNWYERFDPGTHVVVSSEAVVERPCPCRKWESTDGSRCNSCVHPIRSHDRGCSGTIEAVHYEPEPEWLRREIDRLLRVESGRSEYGFDSRGVAEKIMVLLGAEATVSGPVVEED